jgi:predicted methyltransferase
VAKFNGAVFASLKPGGVYLVTDHVASPGAGEVEMENLHRVDPELVKSQVTAAGCVLEADSNTLANPDDPHDIAVFAPSIRGRTDQFVLKFRKPLR